MKDSLVSTAGRATLLIVTFDTSSSRRHRRRKDRCRIVSFGWQYKPLSGRIRNIFFISM